MAKVLNRMEALLSRALLALVLVACAGGPSLAGVRVPTLPTVGDVSKADQAKAAEAYAKASKALNRRRMASALTSAEQAYKLAPNTSTALLRAVALAANKRHLEAFEAYLVAFSLSPTEEELGYIREGLQDQSLLVTPKLGWLKVTAKPKNARITIGEVGFGSGRFVGISAGEHEVVVRADGFQTLRRTLKVTAAMGHVIAIDLVPNPLVKDPVTKDPVVKDPVIDGTGPNLSVSADDGSDAPIIGGALLGAGGLLLAGAVGTHVWALGRADDTERLAAPSLTLSDAERQSQHEAAASDAQLGRVLTGIGYALGVASIVGGVLVLVLDNGDSEADPTTVGHLHPSVWVGPNSTTFSLSGAF